MLQAMVQCIPVVHVTVTKRFEIKRSRLFVWHVSGLAASTEVPDQAAQQLYNRGRPQYSLSQVLTDSLCRFLTIGTIRDVFAMRGHRKRQRTDSERRRVRLQNQPISAFLGLLLWSCSTWLPVSSLAGYSLQQKRGLFPYSRKSIIQQMVLTTPESIIEQASTQNLLDDLIDESVRTSARSPIMMQFNPSSGWIWKRWRGTIFSETWQSCFKSMVYAVVVLLLFKRFPAAKQHLSGFNILWGQLLSVTTFTLTFFVNQSYALWRKCYELSRRLQGRLHDVGLTLAVHAARKAPSSPNEPSTYTTASRQILELVSRYVRLFNVLTYASFTRSHRPILTPRGMRRLVERGLMTAQEREVLVDAEVPATQRHNAVLLWITRVFVEGWQAGHFIGATGFENQILEKIHVCRAQYGAIGDELAGRMPLAYAHIVQILVDAVLWFYPFMAIASQMSDGLVVLGTGLLTISYQGLFDLAKQFLDPYDNESYGKGEDPLVVDTLISETNAGSVRWMNSLNEFPVSPQRIKDGELADYLLPVRGYSVEELAEMEEERIRRERELQERREREEEERRKAEEKVARLRQAAEAMMPALFSENYSVSNSSPIGLGGVNGDAQLPLELPCATTAPFGLSSTAAVSHVVSNMNAMAGGIPSSLLPPGVPASTEDDALVIKERKRQARNSERELSAPVDGARDSGDDEHDEFVGEIEEFHDDGAFEVLEDWGLEENYVHQFQSFDSYKDLPWYDEIGPDGKEIRLSQMLADEVWEEELEASKEKEDPVRTFEEYTRRVEEIRDASSSELAETAEILSAVPNADYSTPSSREGKAEDMYDQTKLDGISQLWGCPPGEISDMPSYSEPFVTGDSEFRGIAQLFGETGTSSPQKSNEYDESGTEDLSSFRSIGALWGGLDGDLDDDVPSGATRPVRETKAYRDLRNQDDDTDLPAGTFQVTDGSEVRLSQMLADEVWEEEALEGEDEGIEKSVSFDEYAQQIADIIEAEKEEQLETEAILNAPSFAEFVGTSEDDKEANTARTANSTQTVDDLAVFEMDVVKDKLDESSNQVSDSDAVIWTEPHEDANVSGEIEESLPSVGTSSEPLTAMRGEAPTNADTPLNGDTTTTENDSSGDQDEE